MLYDESESYLPAKMYRHNGQTCSGGDYYANFRVKEEDIGNEDDKIAQWRGVDARYGSIYLADSEDLEEGHSRRCNTSDGWDCDAEIRVGSLSP